MKKKKKKACQVEFKPPDDKMIKIFDIKPNHGPNPASIFEEILIFTATTSTKKNGSGATLGTLGAEKSKFTKKNYPAKNKNCKFPYFPTGQLKFCII